MKITRAAGYVTLVLTPELLSQDIWLEFLRELKLITRDWIYNDELREWTFPEKYLPAISQLKDRYFKDERQQALF